MIMKNSSGWPNDINEYPEELPWKELSPTQTEHLLTSSWDEPESAIHLNRELLPVQVMDSEIMENTLVFLNAAREGLGATNNGNLKRKVISNFLEQMTWPEGYVEELKEYNKVINEADVSRLHYLRVLLELAELIERKNSTFELTNFGHHYLQEEIHVELYAHLFWTQFQSMNLNYLCRTTAFDEFQQTLNYSLFRLSELDDRWYEEENLLPHVVWFPLYRKVHEQKKRDNLGRRIRWRLFEPLRWFGLLELHKEKKSSYAHRYYWRKSPLYDEFLSFRLPESDHPPEPEEEPEEPITLDDLLEDISKDDLELLLNNVFCPDCGETTIVDYEDSIFRVKFGHTVVRGFCKQCGHKVARYIETGDLP